MTHGLTVQLDLLVYCFNLGSWNINNSLNKCIPAFEQWGVGRGKGKEESSGCISEPTLNKYLSLSFILKTDKSSSKAESSRRGKMKCAMLH